MTVNPKDLDLDALPPEYREAVAVLIERSARADELEVLNTCHSRRISEQAEQIVRLKYLTERREHLITELKRTLYGKRSEKQSRAERDLGAEDLEVALSETEVKRDASPPSGQSREKKFRKKAERNIGNLPKNLPRIEQIIEPDSLECPCGCGDLHRIGEDRSERLDIVPAQLRVIVPVRPKYACRTCAGGVTQAPCAACG